ncbi:polysialyltransferase family glycosyltransferase [Pontibacter chitinilyticus]|uniref:polysialyltransferase family glycosyltransferase n=1 Tax=Pontibacter chitinilyticus TaxID=2674989 RepID=UPI00321B3B64
MPDTDRLRKQRLLLICDYNRHDFVHLYKDCCPYFEIFFLEHTSRTSIYNHSYLKYGTAIFWKDYKDVDALLDTIQPDKLTFQYLDSYNHIVLNLACKARKIPTFQVEHGLRADYVLGSDPAISPSPDSSYGKKFHELFNNVVSLKSRIQTRLFLLNSIKKLSPEDAAFAKLFIKIRRAYSFATTVRKINSAKRQAGAHISFSPKVFEVHQRNETLPPDLKVYFTGIPYFDHLATLKPASQLSRAVLLIDQPLAEHGLLQWDKAYKATFVDTITKIFKQHNYKLYIKPHPKQDLKVWQRAEQLQLCCLIDDKQLYDLTPEIPILLGFYSTYLMPFTSFKHTTVITLENHPAGRLDVSKSFVDAGVAHPIYDLEELHHILPNIEQLHQQQLPNKAKFTEEWMYKFDGKSGERLRDVLLRDEL